MSSIVKHQHQQQQQKKKNNNNAYDCAGSAGEKNNISNPYLFNNPVLNGLVFVIFVGKSIYEYYKGSYAIFGLRCNGRHWGNLNLHLCYLRPITTFKHILPAKIPPRTTPAVIIDLCNRIDFNNELIYYVKELGNFLYKSHN